MISRTCVRIGGAAAFTLLAIPFSGTANANPIPLNPPNECRTGAFSEIHGSGSGQNVVFYKFMGRHGNINDYEVGAMFYPVGVKPVGITSKVCP